MIDEDAFGPGPLTRGEVRQLREITRQLNRPAYLHPPLVGQSDSVADRVFFDDSVLRKLGVTIAKVTSGPTVGPLSEKRYAWTEQVVPQAVTTTDKLGGLSGTTTAGWLVFIDPDDGTQYTGTVAAGVRVPIWKSTEGDWWYTFSSFLDVVGGGSGGASDWEEVDGTPSYTGRTKVLVDQTDGLQLSEPAANQVRIDLLSASKTQKGILDLSDGQYLGDGIKVVPEALVYEAQTAAYWSNPFLGHATWAWSTHSVNDAGAAGTSNYKMQLRFIQPEAAASHWSEVLFSGPVNTFTGPHLTVRGPVPKYCVQTMNGSGVLNTVQEGASGTDAAGSVFVGGICITIGAVGGYSSENAQDDVGTILVDSATIDFTYNDATPSITASVIDDSITYAKMQNVSAASKLLGRGDSGSGDPQEITLGSGLTMTGTTLSASGGGGSPGGSDTQVQFNDGGAFGGDAGLVYNKTTNALTHLGNYNTDNTIPSAGVSTITRVWKIYDETGTLIGYIPIYTTNTDPA